MEDKQNARMKPLDEVKAQIEPAIKQQKAAAAAQRLANSVQSLARTAGLDKAAAEKGLTVITTDFLAQTDAAARRRECAGIDERSLPAKKKTRRRWLRRRRATRSIR